MALNFCDGFDSYATSSDLGKKWSGAIVGLNWSWNATGGRFGGGCVSNSGASAGALLQSPANVGGNGSPSCVGFYLKVSAPPASQQTILNLFGSDNATPNSAIVLLASGAIGGFSGGLRATDTLNICDNTWHWIEISIPNNNASTTFLYIDNLSRPWSVTNNFTPFFFSYAFLAPSGVTMSVDDFIQYDNVSATVPTGANYPLGSRQITTIRPISDGVVQFVTTSSGSTHFSLINEINPDGDTSYVNDGTSGHQDLYNYAALGYTPINISSVMLNSYIKNPNAGSINSQSACKSGATTTLGVSRSTPLIYQTFQTSYGVDPNTAAAWTAAGLNAAQFGIKIS